MGKILCATRGGEESRRTQHAAIALAKARKEELVFLYVADASFLDRTAAPVVVDVEAELERMGRFQLTLAADRAAEEGVEVQIMTRRGQLRTELVAAAQELEASVIVLGSPVEGTAVFDDAALQGLADELRSRTGAEVCIL